ncbi:MAG: hypothetical protein MOGMAGMI_00384 [Candidatus Omnitrophica bacterium]|nr:hypothetical protein [Candidatus Omnitrophota bacterium]
MYYIKKFLNNIKNFFYWRWKLCNDYDYDYSSIYYILNLKLNKMHKKMTKDDWGRPAKAREMVDLKVCAHLAKELLKDTSKFK